MKKNKLRNRKRLACPVSRQAGRTARRASSLSKKNRDDTYSKNGVSQESGIMEIKDEFLSDQDLDLKNMSPKELIAYWNMWLKQAQATNDLDKSTYSHGVFTLLTRIIHSQGE